MQHFIISPRPEQQYLNHNAHVWQSTARISLNLGLNPHECFPVCKSHDDWI